jgi:integrase
VRLSTEETRMKDKRKQWLYRWKNWLMPSAVPGVWKRKEGGHFVRARVVDPTSGRMTEIKRSLPEADEATAHKWLSDERARIRAGLVLAPRPQTRFSDFAVSLLEEKVTLKHIKSARSRERWRHTLEHLIGGTEGVQGFGEMFVDQILPAHIDRWRLGIARLIASERYSPVTPNGWLSIMRVITKAAKKKFQLPCDPMEGIENFDTSEHETYTAEEPNTLDPEQARKFLTCMLEEYPQHYAMTHLGMATGLRPSSMRPIRRGGKTPDVLWDEGVIHVRRSHTLGDEVMNTTKTGLRQRINVPADVIEVLRWHERTQIVTEEQRSSELLFPAEDGRLHSEHVLRTPFARVCALVGLPLRFTPHGMRRTFNDLARAARVESLVTRSISGHLTDRMREHYSTVTPVEQRESIGRVLRLVTLGSTTPGGAPGGAPDPESGAPREEVAG